MARSFDAEGQLLWERELLGAVNALSNGKMVSAIGVTFIPREVTFRSGESVQLTSPDGYATRYLLFYGADGLLDGVRAYSLEPRNSTTSTRVYEGRDGDFFVVNGCSGSYYDDDGAKFEVNALIPRRGTCVTHFTASGQREWDKVISDPQQWSLATGYLPHLVLNDGSFLMLLSTSYSDLSVWDMRSAAQEGEPSYAREGGMVHLAADGKLLGTYGFNADVTFTSEASDGVVFAWDSAFALDAASARLQVTSEGRTLASLPFSPGETEDFFYVRLRP
ncbi:MAG TPA: hypothetical protein VKP30_02515, partial [Polyangiaceae bacterium]|nr:hypothetical protein [Polyangiaceae bacterium]